MDRPRKPDPHHDDENSYVQFAAAAGPMTWEEKQYRMRKGVLTEDITAEETLTFVTAEDESIMMEPAEADTEPKLEDDRNSTPQPPVLNQFFITDMVEEATKNNIVLVASVSETPTNLTVIASEEVIKQSTTTDPEPQLDEDKNSSPQPQVLNQLVVADTVKEAVVVVLPGTPSLIVTRTEEEECIVQPAAVDADPEELQDKIEISSPLPPALTQFLMTDMVEEVTKINAEAVASIVGTPPRTKLLPPVQELQEDEGNLDNLLSPTSELDDEEDENGENFENDISLSHADQNSFYKTCGSELDLDDTIADMERLLALADQLERDGVGEFDMEPFPAYLPCSFVEDILAEKGQGEEFQHSKDAEQGKKSPCQLEEVVLSPISKAKETSSTKKVGFNKIILNELVLSPSSVSSKSDRKTPVLTPSKQPLKSKSPFPSPHIGTKAATPLRQGTTKEVFKTPAVPSKTPSKFKRIEELQGKTWMPTPPMPKDVVALKRSGPGTPTKVSTSTPVLRKANPAPPLSLSSPASTIGFPTPPVSRVKGLTGGTNLNQARLPPKYPLRLQKPTLSPFLMPRKSPGTKVVQTLISPVADYIYNSPPVQQLQHQQRAAVRGHFASHDRIVQSVPRKAHRGDDDKSKGSSIPVRKTSLPLLKGGQGLDLLPGTKNSKQLKTDSPVLINFASPDLTPLTDCESPVLVEYDDEFPAQAQPIGEQQNDAADSGEDDLDGLKIQVPVSLPSDAEELQNLMELSMTWQKASVEKNLKKVNYFGSEKLRDGKERRVEAPIIPFTQVNPIIILGLSNKDNLLAQRHTGLMSESFGTSIVRSEPVIKTSIPTRIGSAMQKK